MTILNKTAKTRDRYRLIAGKMGCIGLPEGHPNHRHQIALGVDRGNGYQGYLSVSYFVGPETPWVPSEAKDNLRKLLTAAELAFIAADTNA